MTTVAPVEIVITKILICDITLRLGLFPSIALRTAQDFRVFTSAGKRVPVQNKRNFSQAKFDSKINSRFLLNEHGDLYFLLHNNSLQRA